MVERAQELPAVLCVIVAGAAIVILLSGMKLPSWRLSLRLTLLVKLLEASDDTPRLPADGRHSARGVHSRPH